MDAAIRTTEYRQPHIEKHRTPTEVQTDCVDAPLPTTTEVTPPQTGCTTVADVVFDERQTLVYFPEPGESIQPAAPLPTRPKEPPPQYRFRALERSGRRGRPRSFARLWRRCATALLRWHVLEIGMVVLVLVVGGYAVSAMLRRGPRVNGRKANPRQHVVTSTPRAQPRARLSSTPRARPQAQPTAKLSSPAPAPERQPPPEPASVPVPGAEPAPAKAAAAAGPASPAVASPDVAPPANRPPVEPLVQPPSAQPDHRSSRRSRAKHATKGARVGFGKLKILCNEPFHPVVDGREWHTMQPIPLRAGPHKVKVRRLRQGQTSPARSVRIRTGKTAVLFFIAQR